MDLGEGLTSVRHFPPITHSFSSDNDFRGGPSFHDPSSASSVAMAFDLRASRDGLLMEECCVKWRSFRNVISDAISCFKDSEKFTDLTLVSSEGDRFEAHQAVLVTCSSYFKALLEGNLSDNALVILENISSLEIHSLLDFVYRGETSVPQEHLQAVLAAGQTLQIKGLLAEKRLTPRLPLSEFSQSRAEVKLTRSPPVRPKGLTALEAMLQRPPLSEDPSRKRKASPLRTLQRETVEGKQMQPLETVIPGLLYPPSEKERKLEVGSHDGDFLLKQEDGDDRSSFVDSDDASSSDDDDFDDDISFNEDLDPSKLVKVSSAIQDELEDEGYPSPLKLMYLDPFSDSDRRRIEDGEELEDVSRSQENESAVKLCRLAIRIAFGQPFPSSSPHSGTSGSDASASRTPRAARESNPLLDGLLDASDRDEPPASPSLSWTSSGVPGDDKRLAFHEPRPCPICKKLYRDAATLRTHHSIMHSESSGRQFTCSSCEALPFTTKYDLLLHRKRRH